MDYTSFLTPTLGVGSIVVLAVLMLLRGDLLSRKQVDAVLSVKDEQIALYKGLYEQALEVSRAKDEQMAALIETSRTTRRVLEAVSDVASHNTERTGGGDHAPAQEAH